MLMLAPQIAGRGDPLRPLLLENGGSQVIDAHGLERGPPLD